MQPLGELFLELKADDERLCQEFAASLRGSWCGCLCFFLAPAFGAATGGGDSELQSQSSAVESTGQHSQLQQPI